MAWVYDNLHSYLRAPWANLILAIVAVGAGSIVGAERQKKDKPAGLRTMILVCLGSSVFTMVSISFDRGEPGHIAAQIVSGIGFLGAGAILRGSVGVTGMTTAASVWMTAAIGMVIGAGYPLAGLLLSCLVLAVLTIIASLEVRHKGGLELSTVTIVFEAHGGKAAIKIEDLLEDYGMLRESGRAAPLPDGRFQIEFAYCHARRSHRELLTSLANMAEVQEIRRLPG